MGLNHMNGRVQDAILGGFLSPDLHITDPTNAQSYNRYSYVNNNPLTYADPTGFEAQILNYNTSSAGPDPLDFSPWDWYSNTGNLICRVLVVVGTTTDGVPGVPVHEKSHSFV